MSRFERFAVWVLALVVLAFAAWSVHRWLEAREKEVDPVYQRRSHLAED